MNRPDATKQLNTEETGSKLYGEETLTQNEWKFCLLLFSKIKTKHEVVRRLMHF